MLLASGICVFALLWLIQHETPTTFAETANATIQITENGLTPPEVTVKPGDRVTWVNATNRTLTLRSGPSNSIYLPLISGSMEGGRSTGASSASQGLNVFDPQTLAPGGSFTFTVNEPGILFVHLVELPNLIGKIKIVIPIPKNGGQIHGLLYTDLSPWQQDNEKLRRKIYLPDMTVYLRDASNVEVDRVRTDLSGRFSFPFQQAGKYTLCWEGEGFVAACMSSQISVDGHLYLGELGVMVERKDGFATLFGEVRLWDSSLPRTFEPFANVNTFAVVKVMAGDQEVRRVFVNNYGDYVMPLAPIHANLMVHAILEKAEGEQSLLANSVPDTASHRMDLRIPNSRPRLEPILTTVGGKPVEIVTPGAMVDVSADATDPDGDGVSYRWILPAGSGQLSSLNGPVVQWQLPSGESLHTITVIAYDGRGGYARATRTVRASDKGAIFAGKIVDPSGGAVDTANVEINGKLASTNSNGFFHLYVPAADRYVMNVRKQGFALLSRIYVREQSAGRWMLTPATRTVVDPTQPIDVTDKERVCPGPVSSRIDWRKYPNQSQPRYQDGSGEVIHVGAQYVDFEDLSPNDIFRVGDNFNSGGLQLHVRSFRFSNGDVYNNGSTRISTAGLAGGSGQELFTNNVNIAMQPRGGASLVTIRFGEYGGNINLAINGDFKNVADFQELDGETIGGVLFSVEAIENKGILRLKGSIQSFAVGGQEFFIDDILIDPLPQLPRDRKCGPGLRVQIPANSLVDSNGNPPPGNVEIAVGTYDILAPDGMPGDYTAETTTGDTAVMESFGAGAIEIYDGSTRYNLQPGAKATLHMPVDSIHYAYDRPIPATIPNLVYNEATGVWEEIGVWNLNGNEYVTEVSHFSAFNTDLVKQDQACVRIVSNTLPETYRLEITIPQGEDAAPKVIGGVVDNSVPYHVVYNLPTETDIVLTVIGAGEDIPIGTFVVNTGIAQDPTDPNLPAYPYNACKRLEDGDVEINQVVLYDPELSDPPSSSQSPATAFLHGLYSFYATNLNEYTPAAPSDPSPEALAELFASATISYYQAIDNLGARDTLTGFQTVNGFDTNPVIHAVYANSGDLGFGRDMYCTRTEVAPGDFDAACYVSNYGTGYDPDGSYGTPDEDDFQAAVNGDDLIATVAMEYSRIEAQDNSLGVASADKAVKFYVYNSVGQRIDGADNLGNVDTGNAFVDLDGFGGRPLPQLCIVCHGGAVSYNGTPSATNTPVFTDGNSADLGSVFLPFDLHAFTIVDGITPVGGVLGEFDKANQQEAFRHLNQEIVAVTEPGAPILELIDEFYPGAGTGDQVEDFVVPGWSSAASHEAMYRNVMRPACRACHLAQINAPGPTFQDASEAVGSISAIRSRVCDQGVMPHARATYDRFWTSTDPHQPAQLVAWGTVHGPGLDWDACATAGPDDAPPIPDIVYHDPLIQNIWDNSCGGAGCHNPGLSGGMSLHPDNAYDQTVDEPSTQAPGLDRIEPFDENDSYLWHKINGTQGSVGGGGSQMPLGGSLGATDIELLQQWILDGALEAE
jgi:plastocyanin